MKRKSILFSAVIFFTVFLAFFVCQGVSAGGEITEIENQINKLEKENIWLAKEIASETSCDKLYQRASANDFRQISLEKNQSETVALKR